MSEQHSKEQQDQLAVEEEQAQQTIEEQQGREVEQFPEEMGAFFDARAEEYDAHMRHLLENHDAYYRAVAGRVRATEEEIRILDLGCGTGSELKPLFDRASRARITGIDMSEGMLEELRDKYKDRAGQLELRCGSYMELDLGADYDYAVSVYTMHHLLPEPKLKLYRRIWEALAPGGLYIEGDCVVSEDMERELLERYWRLVCGMPDGAQYHVDIPFSARTQISLLEAAGFVDICFWQMESEAAIMTARKPGSCLDDGLELAEWASRQWPVLFREGADEVAPGSLWRLTGYDGSRWYVKRAGEERARRGLAVSVELARGGVPALRYEPARDGCLTSRREGQPFLLYRELAGTVKSRLDPEDGRRYGEGLARFHLALAGLPAEAELPEMDLGRQLQEQIFPAVLAEPAWESRMKEQLHLLSEEMTAVDLPLLLSLLPRQPIHRDAHPGNLVLTREEALGFLDLDLVTRGIRIFDLCYLATSQLEPNENQGSQGEPSDGNSAEWLELLSGLRQGYERVSSFTVEERRAAFYVMCSIQLLFAAYFSNNKQMELAVKTLNGLLCLIKNRSCIDEIFRQG